MRHLDTCRRTPRTSPKDGWLVDVLKRGLEPSIELLEEGLGEGGFNAEIRYIQEFREKFGDLITNATEGGPGMSGYQMSESTREKISKAHLGMKMSLESRIKLSISRKGVPAKPFTEAHRRNLSISHKGYTHTEEWKINHAAKMQGKVMGPNSWEALLN